jgi:hypothetical protein
MVSNVDGALASAAAAAEREGAERRAPAEHGLYMSGPGSSVRLRAGSIASNIGVGVALFLVLLVLLGKLLPDRPTSRVSPDVPSLAERFVDVSVMTAATVTGLTMTKPLSGAGNVLEAPEIRYCLAESIRLDAGKGVVNTASSRDVLLFNALVGDYNQRCVQYRYQTDVYDAAKVDVELARATLEAQGRGRFAPAAGGRR